MRAAGPLARYQDGNHLDRARAKENTGTGNGWARVCACCGKQKGTLGGSIDGKTRRFVCAACRNA